MLWTGALAVPLCVSAARAHHSGSMYEATAIWIEGTVVRYAGVNPHSITILEERGADGQVLRWAVEGPPGQAELDRRDVPQVGDVLRFCAFPYKPTAELSRMFPGVDF